MEDAATNWIRVLALEELEPKMPVKVDVSGRAIALFRVGDHVFAIEDRCTHAEAALSDGEVRDEFFVECPLHGSEFDVRTGEPVSLPATEPVPIYAVKIEDGSVWVRIGAAEPPGPPATARSTWRPQSSESPSRL